MGFITIKPPFGKIFGTFSKHGAKQIQVTAESLKSKLFFFKKLKEMGSFTIQKIYSVATLKKNMPRTVNVFYFQASKSSQV